MPRKPEIKNLKKVAKRIKDAVKKKEKIILYGDADLDGVSSVVILKETIQNLGGKISSVYFPDRENDGYGITRKALGELKGFAPALLISVDLGIGNVEEVEIANLLGFEVVIIDHHQILDKLPKASIIVDPKQKGDKYPFKQFANAGLVFKLAEEVLDDKFSESLKNSFLELTALATIADMMPQEQENRLYIDQGIGNLRNTFRPGLRAFFDIFDETAAGQNNLQKIIGALNISERIDNLNETYLLLISSAPKDARRMAQDLLERNQSKQFRVKEIIREVEGRLSSKMTDTIIFEGDHSWSLVLAGSVASTICQRFEKPTFIFKKGSEESIGSVRVPKNINSVDAMASCSELLVTYGGHPPASGFRIKNQNLDKFKGCLIKYFQKQ